MKKFLIFGFLFVINPIMAMEENCSLKELKLKLTLKYWEILLYQDHLSKQIRSLSISSSPEEVEKLIDEVILLNEFLSKSKNEMESDLSSNGQFINPISEMNRYFLKLCKEIGQHDAADRKNHKTPPERDIRVLKLLVEKGKVDVNGVRDDKTALHFLAKSNQIAWVKYLISKGAEQTVKNGNGEMPFEVATSKEMEQKLRDCIIV